MLNLQCHLVGIEQSIVNEAMGYSIFDSMPLLVTNSRRSLDLNVKVIQSRRIRGLLGGDSDDGAFRCQEMLLQVLRRIEAGTGPKDARSSSGGVMPSSNPPFSDV
jgi:hypothetical protein